MKYSFKNIYRFFVAVILINFGFADRAVRRALNGEFVLSVYFHNPTKELFQFCIKWLVKKGLHFIPIEDLGLIQKGLKPFPKGGVLVTVDDGWFENEKNIIEVAEMLNVPVSVFISTGPVKEGVYWWSYLEAANKLNLAKRDIEAVKKMPNSERLIIVDAIKKEVSLEREAMSVTQVKKIAKSRVVTLGAHSVSHPILTNCTAEESFSEIQNSKNELMEWVDKDIQFFSYPNGSYSNREIEYVKSTGYSMAFCTEEEYLTKDRLKEQYRLPRFWINEGASNAENICRMAGLSKKFTFK